MPPRVAVLTPTYNHARFIVECIESVQAQSIEDWEMVVVDDGSNDGTVELAEAKGDSRITIVRQEHRGLSNLRDTYEQALLSTTADVVALLEGDDYWPPTKLAVQLPDFDERNVVLSSGVTELVDIEGRAISQVPTGDLPEDARRNEPWGRAALELLNTEHLTFTFPVSTMVRREALMRIGGFQQPDYLPLVDLPTFLRISLEGSFRFHDQVCGYWRRHGASTSMNRLPSIIDGVYRLASEFLTAHGNRVPGTPEEIDRLDDRWASFQAHRRVVLGRWMLAAGRRAEARRQFLKALAFRGGTKRRLKARIGLFGTLGFPTEWLYRALGVGPWKDEMILPTGDPSVSEEYAQSEAFAFDLVECWNSEPKLSASGMTN